MIALLLIAAITLLQAADVVTTVKALGRGADEINPLGRRLFATLGAVPASIALKLLLTAPIIWLCWTMPDVLVRRIGPIDIRIWHFAALYAASLAWVVRHNLRELALQRREGG